MTTLKIEIKTESEEGANALLQHVFKEITDRDYENSELEFHALPEQGWLKVTDGRLKGAYRWCKE